MITSFDDYPIHQTWQPVAHPESGDPNHYDRYFFNGYSKDGSIFFALAMGLYPNRHVMDSSFSVIKNGEQINLHSSARAPFDRMQCMSVGPITIDIVEPLKRHHISVSSPEHGITADLHFTASSLPYEEPPFHVSTGNRTTMHYTRLTQLGSWNGYIEIDGQRTEIHHNEFACGERWHESGALLTGPDTIQHAHGLTYDFEWEPGTRRAQRFTLNYEFASSSATLVFEPILHFQMFGLGYLHPEWSHGTWKGELVVDSDRFSLPVPDPTAMHHLHVQTLSRVAFSSSSGEHHEGIGVLETLVLGAHQPSGFSGVADGFSA